jgi:hypothetical protein
MNHRIVVPPTGRCYLVAGTAEQRPARVPQRPLFRLARWLRHDDPIGELDNDRAQALREAVERLARGDDGL